MSMERIRPRPIFITACWHLPLLNWTKLHKKGKCSFKATKLHVGDGTFADSGSRPSFVATNCNHRTHMYVQYYTSPNSHLSVGTIIITVVGIKRAHTMFKYNMKRVRRRNYDKGTYAEPPVAMRKSTTQSKHSTYALYIYV